MSIFDTPERLQGITLTDEARAVATAVSAGNGALVPQVLDTMIFQGDKTPREIFNVARVALAEFGSVDPKNRNGLIPVIQRTAFLAGLKSLVEWHDNGIRPHDIRRLINDPRIAAFKTELVFHLLDKKAVPESIRLETGLVESLAPSTPGEIFVLPKSGYRETEFALEEVEKKPEGLSEEESQSAGAMNGGSATMDRPVEERALFDSSGLFAAENLIELQSEFERLINSPRFAGLKIDLVELFNLNIAARVRDPGIGLDESIEYFKALKQVDDETDIDDDPEGNQEDSELYGEMLISLDNKLLNLGLGYLHSEDEEAKRQLGILLSTYQLLASPEAEGYKERFSQYTDLQIGYFRYLVDSAVPTAGPIGGQRVIFTGSTLQASGMDLSIKSERKRAAQAKAQEIKKKLTVVNLDTEAIKNLDEENPIRKMFEDVTQSVDGDVKAEFLFWCLDIVENDLDPRRSYTAANVIEFIDDSDLRQYIITLHDEKLLRHVARLSSKPKRTSDREVIVLLARDVRFLGPDESEIVIRAKQLFIEVEGRFQKSLEAANPSNGSDGEK